MGHQALIMPHCQVPVQVLQPQSAGPGLPPPEHALPTRPAPEISAVASPLALRGQSSRLSLVFCRCQSLDEVLYLLSYSSTVDQGCIGGAAPDATAQGTLVWFGLAFYHLCPSPTLALVPVCHRRKWDVTVSCFLHRVRCMIKPHLVLRTLEAEKGPESAAISML